MIPLCERIRIAEMVKREVVPAIGCTEPIAVALCTARAAEILAARPDKITARLSANVLKNAMGVGIPGTGMIGLPIAVALGALIGRPDRDLEVLCDVTPEAVAEGRDYIDRRRISILLKDDTTEKLYIEIEAETAAGAGRPPRRAVVIIAGGHTSFVYEEVDGKVLLDTRKRASCGASGISDAASATAATSAAPTASTAAAEPAAAEGEPPLTLRRVWDFATESPVEELNFILEARRLNMAAAEKAFTGDFGHGVGRMLRRDKECNIMGDGILSRILSYTTAACDARMAGAMIPVMSNSGSGNQGITATLPVVIYAEQIGASEEQTVRALMLSHLTAIYIKQSLGRLSALCGCVVAATGSSCGITYLMGGGYDEISSAVKNMIANLTGMICDGAKPSCSMKLSSGVSTAVLSAMMAMEGRCVSSAEGIIEDDVDKCIRNLTTIGRDGMNETDRLVLQIMTGKC